MYVVCLEGCHGVGKSTLLNTLEREGFTTLDEAFLDLPKYALHPQTLTMEVVWVSNWFMRLLKLKHDMETEGRRTNTIFFADRSPYSAVFYSKSRYSNNLEGVIKGQIEELSRLANIHVVTVRLNADREIVWNRISERLKVEPERIKFNENDRSWMNETMDWYDGFQWDITVDNGTISSEQCAPELVSHLCSNFPLFSTSLPELACRTIKLSRGEETIINNSPKKPSSRQVSPSIPSASVEMCGSELANMMDENPKISSKTQRALKSSPVYQDQNQSGANVSQSPTSIIY